MYYGTSLVFMQVACGGIFPVAPRAHPALASEADGPGIVHRAVAVITRTTGDRIPNVSQPAMIRSSGSQPLS